MYNEVLEPPKAKKPTLDLLKMLNTISIKGPVGNVEYFKGLIKEVQGITEEFQGSTSSTPSLTDISGYVASNGLTGTIPVSFQTGPTVSGSTPSTLSQIDMLNTFYDSVVVTRDQILQQIRTFIWTRVNEYRTIVDNVVSIKSRTTADENTVYTYTEAGINGMDVAALVAAWNAYTSAKTSFLDTVDAALTPQQSLFDRLFRTYNLFRQNTSVSSVASLSTIDATIVNRTFADLKSNNYSLVNSYFNTSDGFLLQLTNFARTQLDTWETAYQRVYNALPSSVKSAFPYNDQVNPTSTQAETLITYMSTMGGITLGPSVAGPAPTTGITQLATSSLQRDALNSVTEFYRTLIDNLVVFSSINDITTGPLSDPFQFTVASTTYTLVGAGTVVAPQQANVTLGSLVTSISVNLQNLTGLLDATALSSRDQVTIAGIRARYDAGIPKLIAYAKAQFQNRVREYQALREFASTSLFGTSELPSTLPTFEANDRTATFDDATFATKKYEYFVTNAAPLVGACQQLFGTLRAANTALRNNATFVSSPPALPTVVPPSFTVNAISGTFDLASISMKAVTSYNNPRISPDITNTTDLSAYLNSTTTGNATVYALYDIRTMIQLLTTSLRAQLNYRNQLVGLMWGAMGGSVTPTFSVGTSVSDIAAIYNPYNTGVRNYVWGTVSTYQTVVRNVSSIKSITAGNETVVNSYTQSGINEMSFADLATSWTNYTTAKQSFLDTVDAVILPRQNVYDRLYRAYNLFRNTTAVSNISNAVTEYGTDIGEVPTMAQLRANNYAIVNSYFRTTDPVGFLSVLRAFVADKINAWEEAYKQLYGQLDQSVRDRFTYNDQITDASDEETLISYMIAVSGITLGPSVAGPAPTTQIAELVTSSLQNTAIKAISTFYNYLYENLVVLTRIADIGNAAAFTVASKVYTFPGGGVTAAAQTGITLSSLATDATSNLQSLDSIRTSALGSRDQQMVAQLSARYEEGLVQLRTFAISQFQARVREYQALQELASTSLGFSSDEISAIPTFLTADSTNSYTDDVVFASKKYEYFITKAASLVSGCQQLYGIVRSANTVMHANTAVLSTKPALPTVATPMFSGVNPITGTFDLSLFSMITPTPHDSSRVSPPTASAAQSSYLSSTDPSTVYAIYDMGIMIRFLNTSLRAELNYRNRLLGAIWNAMFVTLSPFYGGLTGPTYPAIWSDKTAVSDIIGDYTTYNNGLNAYVAALQERVQASLTAYSNLYSEYNTFRRSALRITETGAAAPSAFRATIPLVDNDIATIPTQWPTPNQHVITAADVGTALQNKLVLLGQKYGPDGTSIPYSASASDANTRNLLPKLVNLTRTEVSDYIQKYGAQYSSSLSTLTPSLRSSVVNTSDADLSALAPSTVDSTTIRNKMSSYTTTTGQLLEAVDRDAVLDLMATYINVYTENLNVMSTETQTGIKKVFFREDATARTMTDVATEIGRDTNTITSETFSLQTITTSYNRYDAALSTVYKGLVGDLETYQIDISGLRTTFNHFYNNYNEFYTLVEATGTWATEATAPTDTMLLPPTTYTDQNYLLLTTASDALIERIVIVVTSVLGKVKMFKDLIDANVGSGDKLFNKYNTISDADIAGVSMFSIINHSLKQLPEKSDTSNYNTVCLEYISLLKNIPACIVKISEFMDGLRDLVRPDVQGQISTFLSKYNTDLRQVLKQPGVSVDFQLAATNVCVKPSSVSSSVNCSDTTESTTGESFSASSEFVAGYPFLDYRDVSAPNVTFTTLVAKRTRYALLIPQVEALGLRLLGVRAIRPIVKGYVERYYTDYNSLAVNLISSDASTSYYSQYQAVQSDIGAVEVYIPNVRNSEFVTVSAAFNALDTEKALTDIFSPYATARAASTGVTARQMGAAYRRMLNLLAAAVISKINDFKTIRYNPDFQVAINARIALNALPADLTQNNIDSYTATDIAALQQSNVELTKIDEIAKKYVTFGNVKGLISQLNDEIDKGDITNKKSNDVQKAMIAFKAVYDNFTNDLFNGKGVNNQYDSENLQASIRTMLREVNDPTNDSVYLDSNLAKTETLKSQNDSTLDALKDAYANTIPATWSQGTSQYTVNYAAVPYSPSNPATLTMVGLIKERLINRMNAVKATYESNGVNFWAATFNTHLDSNFRQGALSTKVTRDVAAVGSASTEASLRAFIREYLGVSGFEGKLPEQQKIVNDITAARNLTLPALQLYTSWETIFATLLSTPTYDPPEKAFRNEYLMNGSVTTKFNEAGVGNDNDTVTFPATTATLKGITNYYTTTAIPNIVTEIGKRIKELIAAVRSQYSGQALFGQEFATRGVIAAPSVFANAPAVAERTRLDAVSVDAEMPPNPSPSSINLVKLYVTYAGSSVVSQQQRTLAGILDSVSGLQSELTTLETAVSTRKRNREEARDEIVAYYKALLPFVGSGEVLAGVANIKKQEVETYLQLSVNASRQLVYAIKDSFFALNDTTLDSIEFSFKALNRTDVVYGNYSTAPNPVTVTLLNVIRYYVIGLITDTQGTYNTNKQFLFIPGVTLEADLQETTFNAAILEDIDTAKTATDETLKALQDTYTERRNRIINKGGDLAKTFALRPKTIGAKSAYMALFQKFQPFDDISETSVYNTMMQDYNNLQSADIDTSVDNKYLDCERKKYINPFGSDLSGVKGVDCDNSTINGEFNRKQNAYFRLLLVCRELVKKKIDSVVDYYNSNKTQIEEDGVAKLSVKIRYIIYNLPESSLTEPNRDKADIDATSASLLEDKLISMQSKYYVGNTCILEDLKRAQFGGSTKGIARGNLNAAMTALVTENTKFSILFTYSSNKYNSFLLTNTKKYLAFLGIGNTQKSKSDAYKYNDTLYTDAFMALNETGNPPNLASEKLAFENMLKLASNDTYFSCVRAALVKVCDDYKAYWDQQTRLFSFLEANTSWRPLPILNPYPANPNDAGFVDTDKEMLNSYSSQTLTEVSSSIVTIMNKYLYGDSSKAGLFALLDSDILQAQLEEKKYHFSVAIRTLSEIYVRYQSLGIEKPAKLVEAEQYYDVSTSSFKSTTDFSKIDLVKLRTDLEAASLPRAVLLSSVRARLSAVITSYKSLRNSFLEFYDENKGSLPINSFFDNLNRTQLDSDDDRYVGTLGNILSDSQIAPIFTYYMGVTTGQQKSRFQELIDFVQAYFSDPAGAIQTYQATYTSFFTSPTRQIQAIAAAPFAFGAPTAARDLAIVGAPRASPQELLELTTTYNRRYDYIRATNQRMVAAKAISDYWNLLASIPLEVRTAEIDSSTFRNSQMWINTENTSAPNYPFTDAFMAFETIPNKYSEIENDYKQARNRLAQSVALKYKGSLQDFMEKWDIYSKLVPKPSGIRHVDEMTFLNGHITSVGIDVVSAEMQDITKIYSVNGKSVIADTMFSNMKDFIKQLELYFLTDEYKNCLRKDISARSSSVQNTQGAFDNLFNAGGTSRWAFF